MLGAGLAGYAIFFRAELLAPLRIRFDDLTIRGRIAGLGEVQHVRPSQHHDPYYRMISFTEVAKQRQLQKIRRRGLVEQAAQPTPGATWAKCWMYTAPWKRSIVAGTIISGFTYKSIAVTIFVSNQFGPSEYKD